VAIGDLVTGNYQFEYNSLLLGDTTLYEISRVGGLDLPNMRDADISRPLEHGGFAGGPDLLSSRTIDILLNVYGGDATTTSGLLAALDLATMVREDETPLVFQLPGQIKRRIGCRPRRREMDVNLDYVYGIPAVKLQFEAMDPRMYDNTLSSATMTIAVASDGLDFDIVFDLDIGTVVGGLVSCTNSGNTPVYPQATLPGPITNPSIINTTTGKTLRMVGSVDSGDSLIVDFYQRTILLNGTSSRYNFFDSNVSEWWTLQPGANSVQYSTSSGTASGTLYWRSGWL
jgi:hypothetical protein